MCRFFVILLLLIAPNCALAQLADQKQESTSELAQELIEKLGSESYWEREKSMRTLWLMEEEALEALEQQDAATNPEIRIRARRLVEDIEMGILPNTPEDVVGLIRGFFKGDQVKKIKNMEQLKERGLHRQILRLYMMESDEADREKLKVFLDDALQQMVAGLWNEKKVPELENALKRYREIDGALIKWAEVLEAEGRLEQGFREEDDLELKLAMARVLGEREEVKTLLGKLAKDKEGEQDSQKLEITLGFLEGDLRPYLAEAKASSTQEMGLQLARLRYDENKKERAKIVKELLEIVNTEGEQEAGQAVMALTANGYLQEVLPLMKRNFSEEQLSFYEVSSEWEAFFDRYGLSPDELVPEEWIEKELKKVRNKISSSGYELDEYLIVANLYYQLGHMENALRLTRPLYEMVMEEGNKEWLERFFEAVMNRRLNSDRRGLIPVVLELMKEEKGLHEEAVSLFAKAMLSGGQGSDMMFWELLSELKPAWSKLNRLKTLAYLSGGMDGKEGVDFSKEKGQEFIESVKNYSAEVGGREQPMVLEQLYRAGHWMLDRELAMWCVDELLKVVEEGEARQQWVEAKAALLGTAGEWEALRQHLSAYDLDKSDEPSERARQMVISYHLDDRKTIEEKFEALQLELKKNELGSEAAAESTLLVLGALSDGSCYSLVRQLAEQMMLRSAFNSAEWQYGVLYLGICAEKEGDWKVAEAAMRRLGLRHMSGYMSYSSASKARAFSMKADIYLARIMAEAGDKDRTKELFQHCFDNVPGMVQLADDFFPTVRDCGMLKEHDQWFEKAYEVSLKRLEVVSHSPNDKNSIAWLCSRAQMNLEKAKGWVSEAVEAEPKNYAYIHTLGEVYFAQENIEKAVELCEEANRYGSLQSAQMREELDRFKRELAQAE